MHPLRQWSDLSQIMFLSCIFESASKQNNIIIHAFQIVNHCEVVRSIVVGQEKQ